MKLREREEALIKEQAAEKAATEMQAKEAVYVARLADAMEEIDKLKGEKQSKSQANIRCNNYKSV